MDFQKCIIYDTKFNNTHIYLLVLSTAPIIYCVAYTLVTQKCKEGDTQFGSNSFAYN